MTPSNPILGTVLHAIGGVSASTCYLPYTKTPKWSWGTFWLVQALFAWIIMPVLVGLLTIPGFFSILHDAPSKPFWMAFFLGAAYGFGGMSFGKAINHIGYSLTYTLAIGISAVLGTILPMLILGGIDTYFIKAGRRDSTFRNVTFSHGSHSLRMERLQKGKGSEFLCRCKKRDSICLLVSF